MVRHFCGACPAAIADDYVGESCHTLEARTKRHAWATRVLSQESAIAQHYAEEHPEQCLNPIFRTEVLDHPNCRAKRLISEALHIHALNPSLNRKFEGGASQNAELYLDMSHEERQQRHEDLQSLRRRQWS